LWPALHCSGLVATAIAELCAGRVINGAADPVRDSKTLLVVLLLSVVSVISLGIGSCRQRRNRNVSALEHLTDGNQQTALIRAETTVCTDCTPVRSSANVTNSGVAPMIASSSASSCWCWKLSQPVLNELPGECASPTHTRGVPHRPTVASAESDTSGVPLALPSSSDPAAATASAASRTADATGSPESTATSGMFIRPEFDRSLTLSVSHS
jgi:hypothetical protein